MDTLIQTVCVYALPVLFAITLHEAAHGYAARHFGDPTAYLLGRITLNPLKHIDPIGTIVMPLALYFMTGGAFLFGYAKPVPVSFSSLRNPRWDGMWVALAGPACNLLQALAWACVLKLLALSGSGATFFSLLASAGILVNLVMCIFNLFPLPPLDGGRVLTSLLPPRAGQRLAALEPYGFVIAIILIVTGVLTNFWLRPLVQVALKLLAGLFALSL
jgi:Zn-dependent protease